MPWLRRTNQPGPPPPCGCGCGKPVRMHRGIWNKFLRDHQPRRYMPTPEQRERIRERMRANNPMKNPEVASRVSAKTRGRPRPKHPEWIANVTAASRARMLSDRNPMKNPEISRRVHAKWLERQGPSRNESEFYALATAQRIPLTHTGEGVMWIGQRNPDFRVPGQKKCIEVTQRECFVNRKVVRTHDSYAIPTIRHYQRFGWECLVVYREHKRRDSPELWPMIRTFCESTAKWSGIWSLTGSLLPVESLSESASTTSPATP